MSNDTRERKTTTREEILQELVDALTAPRGDGDSPVIEIHDSRAEVYGETLAQFLALLQPGEPEGYRLEWSKDGVWARGPLVEKPEPVKIAEGIRYLPLYLHPPVPFDPPGDPMNDELARWARWERGIRALCVSVLPDVDGSTCDSGDPLDCALTEIKMCFNHLREHPHVPDQESREAMADKVSGILRAVVRGDPRYLDVSRYTLKCTPRWGLVEKDMRAAILGKEPERSKP